MSSIVWSVVNLGYIVIKFRVVEDLSVYVI